MNITPLTVRQFLDLARPGLTVHIRSSGRYGKMIRWCLTKWQRHTQAEEEIQGDPSVWGSHDGIVVKDIGTGGLGVGEALFDKGGCITPVGDYAMQIASGSVDVLLLKPIGVDDDFLDQAAKQWLSVGQGKPYDYLGVWRLFLKSLFMDVFIGVAEWKWANWCTEAVAACYIGAGKDIFCSKCPTPLTTEHRIGLLPSQASQHTLELVGQPLAT